jgi:hypothetical protein
VMRAIERELSREDGGGWTYETLARRVYSTESPTRAQRSAVARAVSCLDARLTVWVGKDNFDKRARVVHRRPPVTPRLAEHLDRAPNGLTYQALGRRVYTTPVLSSAQMTSVIDGCHDLIADGRAWTTVSNGLLRVMSAEYVERVDPTPSA